MCQTSRVTLCLLFAGFTCLTAAQGGTPAWRETADRQVAEASLPDGPGGAVGVVVDGELVYSRGFGYANLDHKIANNPDTVFGLASCAKQFTAATALLLSFDGDLDLDEDIRRILPELALRDAVPVHRLMTHTSGLQDYSELQILARGRAYTHTYSPDEILELIHAQTSRCFAPGERVLYSNTNYVLLARVVERVSGRSLRQLAHERIFEPLGMTSTYFRDNNREVSPNRATGYFRERGSGEHGTGPGKHGTAFRTALTSYEKGLVGPSGLQSSVNDLAKWMANFMHPSPAVGGRRLIDELTKPGTLNDGTTLTTARGLMFGTLRNQRWVEHAGHSDVNNSLLTWWRDAGVATIVLTNESSINPWGITNPVIRQVLGDRLAPAEGAASRAGDETAPAKSYLKLSPRQMQRYTGTYAGDFPVGDDKPPHGGVGTVRVFVDGGQLKAHLPMGFDVGLLPLDETTFDVAAPGRSMTLRFHGLGGPDQSLSWHDAEDSDTQPEWNRKLDEPEAAALDVYVGSYRASDLLDSEPLRITREGKRLFMHWGKLQLKQEVFRVSAERLTTYSDKMQCNLVFTFDASGRGDGFTYEGHRVWNLRFDRLP